MRLLEPISEIAGQDLHPPQVPTWRVGEDYSRYQKPIGGFAEDFAVWSRTIPGYPHTRENNINPWEMQGGRYAKIAVKKWVDYYEDLAKKLDLDFKPWHLMLKNTAHDMMDGWVNYMQRPSGRDDPGTQAVLDWNGWLSREPFIDVLAGMTMGHHFSDGWKHYPGSKETQSFPDRARHATNMLVNKAAEIEAMMRTSSGKKKGRYYDDDLNKKKDDDNKTKNQNKPKPKPGPGPKPGPPGIRDKLNKLGTTIRGFGAKEWAIVALSIGGIWLANDELKRK